MKTGFVAFFAILFCISGMTSAQEQPQPVSLIIHVEGKRKPSQINSANVVISDNDQKLPSDSVKFDPAFGRDAVFAILVDASGSMQFKVAFTKKSVTDIFDAASSSGNSKGLLFTFAETLEGGKGWVSRNDVQQEMSNFLPKRGAPSPLYAAIVEVAKSLGKQTAERRLLFVVTDGDDTSAGVSSQAAVDACLRSGVTIIPLGVLSDGKEKVEKTNLLALANGTGGRAILLDRPANINTLVTEILKSEYIVMFRPQNGSGLHRVKMEMIDAPKGVTLKAPEGYYTR